MSELQRLFQVRAEQFVASAVTLTMEALRMNRFTLRPKRMVVTENYISNLSNMLIDFMYQSQAAGRLEIPDYLQGPDRLTKFNGLVVECLKTDRRIVPKFVP